MCIAGGSLAISWEIMCAAVNSLDSSMKAATSTAATKTTRKSSTALLCCTPCCCFRPPPSKQPAIVTHDTGDGSHVNASNTNPFNDSPDGGDDFNSVIIDDLKTVPNSASFPSRQLVFTPQSPSTSSCPGPSPAGKKKHHPPTKLGFLVSFLVDARGGAMKGNRGSGMRLIIPPGIVCIHYLELC